jgi:hypothetical protein
MLFAQVKAPATAPAVPPAGEVREAPPGAPTAPTAPANDSRTTRASGEPAPGQVRDPQDTRTTRDEAFDPNAIPEAQRRGPIQYDPAFQSSATVRGQAALAEEGGIVFRPGGFDYGFQGAIVEGYNDNVVQTQDVTDGPVTRHPSPFIGIDVEGMMRLWSGPFDPHEFRLQLRAQHYTPLDKFDEPDDGSAILSYTGQFTLTKKDVLVNRFITTASTLNGSRLSDGPVLTVEPSASPAAGATPLSQLQRSFTLTNARSALTHEISPRLRYTHGVDLVVGTTIRDAPIQQGNELVFHHGLDFVQPGTDGQLFYDLSDSDIASARLRYELTYTAFLIDFSQPAPVATGTTATTHIGEATLGLTHSFSDSLRWLNSAGIALATSPPLDPDTRPILSPVATTELLLTKQYWLANVNASYSYGSASPRLGFGPTAASSAGLQGYPFPHTPGWRNLAVLLAGTVNRSVFRTTDALSRITYVLASADLRYALNRWLGLIGGYSYRYVFFEGAQQLPTLYRNVFFLGVTGYWNTDRSLPLITTFSAPISSG